MRSRKRAKPALSLLVKWQSPERGSKWINPQKLIEIDENSNLKDKEINKAIDGELIENGKVNQMGWGDWFNCFWSSVIFLYLLIWPCNFLDFLDTVTYESCNCNTIPQLHLAIESSYGDNCGLDPITGTAVVLPVTLMLSLDLIVYVDINQYPFRHRSQMLAAGYVVVFRNLNCRFVISFYCLCLVTETQLLGYLFFFLFLCYF